VKIKKLFAFLIIATVAFYLLSSSKLTKAQGFSFPGLPPPPPLPQLSHVAVCEKETLGSVRCNARVVTDSKGNVKTNTKPSGYGPSQLTNAYNLNGNAVGNPIIAIVDAYGDPNIQNDLNKYSTTFGISALPTCQGSILNSSVPCFQKVDQNGGTHYPVTNSGWALETALDVETVHAVCPNCKILLVEASSSSYSNLMIAVDRARLLGAKVISNSYGSTEFSSETSYDSHFNYPGIAFTFSSGDSGYGVEYPASSKYVTAVGGTSLYINNDNSWNSETAWNGAGSGCSKFEIKPAWQTDQGCAKRTVVDVSADANPSTGAAVYNSVSYNGVNGWFQVGGTSLASPIVASAYAISGNYGQGLSYNFATSTNLHDIITGSNGNCGGSYLCTSLPGYDGPTGLGSPNGTGAF
jgi:subtilase family serine protease